MRPNTWEDVKVKISLADVLFDGSPCWRWEGACSSNGYGTTNCFGKQWSTHRLFYQQLVGPLVEGMVIDHLCKNRACCNPAHLEQVPQKVNVARGNLAQTTSARCAAQQTCKNGHIFDRIGRQRSCSICAKARMEKFLAKKKEEVENG